MQPTKANASYNGKMFEMSITSLTDVGFRLTDVKDPKSLPKGRYIIQNAGYKNLLQHYADQSKEPKQYRGRTEFLIVADDIKPTKEVPVSGYVEIRIDAKYQEVSGTTQQKLTYTVLDLQQSSSQKHNILVVDGPGYDKNLIALNKSLCADPRGIVWDGAPNKEPNKVVILNLKEFKDWYELAFT